MTSLDGRIFTSVSGDVKGSRVKALYKRRLGGDVFCYHHTTSSGFIFSTFLLFTVLVSVCWMLGGRGGGNPAGIQVDLNWIISLVLGMLRLYGDAGL